MDTTKAVTHVGLCAGYGGIELGLSRAIPNLRSVALCEIEAFACANLVAKMEAGLMDAAPIWTDLKTFPWAEFRGRVDILTSGYPCQPFSAAGKRLGKEDPRHLWPFIADGIRLMRPNMCFFENVEGHITLGLSSVISDLEELGYKVSWGVFSAVECGAPHQRKRVFILAHCQQQGLERYRRYVSVNDSQGREEPTRFAWPSRPGFEQFGWEPPRVVADNSDNKRSNRRIARIMGGESNTEEGTRNQFASTITYSGKTGAELVANPKSSMSGVETEREWRENTGGGGEEIVEDSSRILRTGEGRELRWRRRVCETSEGVGDSSTPRWSQHCAGLNESQDDSGTAYGDEDNRQTQPSMGGDADGPADRMDYAELYTTCDNRTDELRLLGNGVVPAVAERAFRTLLTELLT